MSRVIIGALKEAHFVQKSNFVDSIHMTYSERFFAERIKVHFFLKIIFINVGPIGIKRNNNMKIVITGSGSRKWIVVLILSATIGTLREDVRSIM